MLVIPATVPSWRQLVDVPVDQMGPTDLTMYCNGEKIHMHKYLLYLKLPFFRGIFDVDGWETHAPSNHFMMYDNADALRIVINSLYTPAWSEAYRGEYPMEMAVKVYVLADKWGVKSLQAHVPARLTMLFGRAAKNRIPDFIATVRAAEKCTSASERTLWDVILDIFRLNALVLMRDRHIIDLVQSMPVLRRDLEAWSLLGSIAVRGASGPVAGPSGSGRGGDYYQ